MNPLESPLLYFLFSTPSRRDMAREESRLRTTSSASSLIRDLMKAREFNHLTLLKREAQPRGAATHGAASAVDGVVEHQGDVIDQGRGPESSLQSKQPVGVHQLGAQVINVPRERHGLRQANAAHIFQSVVINRMTAQDVLVQPRDSPK
jgi:hypothetical protein